MSQTRRSELFPIELPLMHVRPDRTLAWAYAYLDDLDALHRLRQAVEGEGGRVDRLYLHPEPQGARYSGTFVLDLTEASGDVARLDDRLSSTPGVHLVGILPPRQGLVASEKHLLQVAGMPMVVLGRETIGNLLRSLTEPLPQEGEDLLYRTGIAMGRMAASDVPPLLNTLHQPLTVEMLKERINDFQVFGWAEVARVSVDENLRGELVLHRTFESEPWHGEADGPRCHFIRGFTAGVYSMALNTAFDAEETACEARGDSHCRIVFQRRG